MSRNWGSGKKKKGFPIKNVYILPNISRSNGRDNEVSLVSLVIYIYNAYIIQ